MTKDRFDMTLLRIALAAAIAAALTGCSGWGNKSNEYKGAQARASKPLEVPPELSSPTMDDRYAIPDPRDQTTYSAYSQRTGNQPGQAAPGTSAVLPKIEGVRFERAGDQRWLVVKGEADRVWPVVRDFWVEAGYPLSREQPEIGIMETEWHEDRSKIPDDIIRRTIGRVLENLYSTSRRDRFRTRLEKGAEPGTTEVFVSNRAMEEVYTNTSRDTTKWQPLPADRELEAEMLVRMQAKIAGNDAKVAAATASAAAARPGPTRATQAPIAESRNAVLENAGAGPLVVNDSFDRAWRRVGLALDRVGFTVEDRDRSKGLFFVRYIDPEADLKSAKDSGGFLDKLAFWKPAPKPAAPQFRIHVSDAGASMSQVQVQNTQGAPESSSTGKRILTLLYDQLK
ncbi:MAG TPA: outer membrane protein assembly factor BamC [Usitatibacter sp.]|nr:outer membrane protein assembly factor BamC [Usitatibacter sp.]